MTTTDTPPAELAVPRHRFWGDRKPPKNRADMFSVAVAPRAAAGDAGSATQVATGSVATLRIYGPIDSWGGWWGISAQDVAQALDSLPEGVTELRVRINSPGGEAWEGLAILNMLRAHPANAVAVVDGIAASAASIIAAGCDVTVMSPGTQLMIHDASAFAYGDASTMEKAKRFLDSVSNSLASIYAEAAGGDVTEWRAVMVEETWYTAAEAVTAGLADRVAVVPDAGASATAGDDEDEDEPVEPGEDPGEVENRFDLSIYAHAGRSQAPAPRFPTASAGGSTPTHEGSLAVAFSDEQLTTMRQELGLPENADEATIVAALSEALEERAESTPSNTSTSRAPEGMSLVDNAVLDELRATAEQGRAAREQQLQERREALVAAAVSDGRIPPARREAWTAQLAADPGAEATLASLAPGLVPVEELGHSGDAATDRADALASVSDDSLDAFAASLGISKEALRG